MAKAPDPKTQGAAIEPMAPGDWEEVRRIYLEGIAKGDATFETEAPSFPQWDAAHRREARLVARGEGSLLGWAALSPISPRRVYAGVAEVSVYVARAARGRGIGKSLLTELVRRSEQTGVWTLQAGIFPENEASLALHRGCGFRLVGTRRRLARLAGIWRDVMLLERRSDTVGLSEAEG
ncbi:MAG: GNAT family N-acetyltransferase [Thermoanaerobaculia bacterium]